MNTFRLTRRCVPVLCGLAAALLGGAARAQDEARGVAVEAVSTVNDNPAFMVRVRTDHPDAVYKYGDLMKVFVKSEKAGYLYLLYMDSEGKKSVLFPNKYQPDNRIPANEEIRVPARDDEGFRLRIGPPAGKELLVAVVKLTPYKSLKVEEVTKSAGPTPITDAQFKGVVVEAMGGPNQGGTIQDNKDKLKRKPREYNEKARDWAEHHIVTTVVKDDAPTGQGKKRRLGVFVGISNFQSPQIRKLRCSHKDAQEMAEFMRTKGGLTEPPVILTDAKATLKNVETAILRDLPAKTRPGDEVVIYWSGHGGRCAAVAGSNEPDGFDEFLVPYDGRLDDIDTLRTTMLMDDTFGRWVQALDGRKVIVILDACHSGGQASTPAKGLEDYGKGIGLWPEAAGKGGDDARYKTFFFSTELSRMKDIGQKDTLVLASSRASQVSFERKEGDLSVFTYYLLDQLNKAARTVSAQDSFDYLREKVPAYVMEKFPGATQTPVLVPQPAKDTYVRP
jgi:hypothetical protein